MVKEVIKVDFSVVPKTEGSDLFTIGAFKISRKWDSITISSNNQNEFWIGHDITSHTDITLSITKKNSVTLRYDLIINKNKFKGFYYEPYATLKERDFKLLDKNNEIIKLNYS